jgi:hypothetical protein
MLFQLQIRRWKFQTGLVAGKIFGNMRITSCNFRFPNFSKWCILQLESVDGA